MKRRVCNVTGLTCSVGIAPVKFLAKIASDLKKPDGLTIIKPQQVGLFIDTLPIEKVPGVGKVMWGRLHQFGIKTLGDMKRHPEEFIVAKFGRPGKRLIELSSGLDHSRVVPSASHKSISSEETLEFNTASRSVLKDLIIKQSREVARELRKTCNRAKTVTIKVKYSNFKQVSRSRTLPEPTRTSETIRRHAVQLLMDMELIRNVRLIGVGVSNFVPEHTPVQMGLFKNHTGDSANWEKVDKVIDALADRFGPNVIRRAGLTS